MSWCKDFIHVMWICLLLTVSSCGDNPEKKVVGPEVTKLFFDQVGNEYISADNTTVGFDKKKNSIKLTKRLSATVYLSGRKLKSTIGNYTVSDDYILNDQDYGKVLKSLETNDILNHNFTATCEYRSSGQLIARTLPDLKHEKKWSSEATEQAKNYPGLKYLVSANMSSKTLSNVSYNDVHFKKLKGIEKILMSGLKFNCQKWIDERNNSYYGGSQSVPIMKLSKGVIVGKFTQLIEGYYVDQSTHPLEFLYKNIWVNKDSLIDNKLIVDDEVKGYLNGTFVDYASSMVKSKEPVSQIKIDTKAKQLKAFARVDKCNLSVEFGYSNFYLKIKESSSENGYGSRVYLDKIVDLKYEAKGSDCVYIETRFKELASRDGYKNFSLKFSSGNNSESYSATSLSFSISDTYKIDQSFSELSKVN